ncbi:MAG: hypothetical protein WDZ53_06585 [Balneolales bacterium]
MWLVILTVAGCNSYEYETEERIQPFIDNPWYWQYKGEPVLLLGGSDQDNLFNHPDLPPDGLEAHLDRLISVGQGRSGASPVRFYLRNTMSSRDNGPNVWWFNKDIDTGLYDLDSFNDEYWERFENFMDLTSGRDIIVQIELWDRFDFAREPWDLNPFNPGNNMNYTAEETGLPEQIDTHPGQNENPFFYSVPELENNETLLAYQEAVVSKVLEIGLQYGHVLYCISNETNGSPLWSEYWARFLHDQADEAGTGIEVTEMWDAWDLTDEEHRNTFDHPDLYSYVDISQNSHQRGQTHWDNMQKARELITVPRPVNTVKIYGGTPHGHGTEEGTRRLWRNIFGGLASSRFHRPESGAGLSDTAMTHLSSAYMFVNEIDVFTAEPANDLLGERDEDEAYSMAVPDRAYAVYFTDGGSVTLDISEAGDTFTVRWLNIMESEWTEPETVQSTTEIRLTAPEDGQWAVLVQI